MGNFRDGNYARAIRQWQSLAKNGNADALFNLGQVYRSGLGTDQNLQQAFTYLQQAADAGHTPAQRELANLIAFDFIGTQTRESAFGLWQTAARNGDGRAQYVLGLSYFNGDLTQKDIITGYAWTLLALEAGVPEAVQSELVMRPELTEPERNEAFALSSIFMTGYPRSAEFFFLINEIPGRRAPEETTMVAMAKEQDEAPEITDGGQEEPPKQEEPAVMEEEELEKKQPEETTSDKTEEPVLEEMTIPAEEIPEEISLVAKENEPVQTAVAEDLLTEDRLEVLPVPEETVPEEGLSGTTFEEQSAEVEEQLLVLEGTIQEEKADENQEEDAFIQNIEPEATLAGEEKNLPLWNFEPEPVLVTEADEEEKSLDLGDPNSPLVDQEGFGDQWSVQVASFRTPEKADEEWQALNAKHEDLFAGLERKIVRFDVGGEIGVRYRLRIGPFPNKESADQKCLDLTEAGVGCLVIWP